MSLSLNAIAMRIPDSLVRGPIILNDGFSLDPSHTKWVRVTTENQKDKMEALFQLKTEASVATFTVRVDKETDYESLQDYANKWLKSYGQFGLEVLGHKYFKNENNENGLVVDLKNSSAHKKLRQVIFFRNAKAIVMTCMDQISQFSTTIKNCNDLIHTFTWIKTEPNTEPSKGLINTRS